MPYAWDADFSASAKDMIAILKGMPSLPVHDVAARREMVRSLASLNANRPRDPLVQRTEFSTSSADGSIIPLFWFDTERRKASQSPTAAILHTHGGGMVAGSVAQMEMATTAKVSAGGVPVLSVEYRLAPEAKGVKMIEDAYAGLTWLRDHAAELNIDPTRIVVQGESAGAGIAAGLALYARDQEFSPPIAKQVLIYPMLDDTNVGEDPDIAEFLVWKPVDNVTGWTALLGEDVVGTGKVSIYNAPTRAKDLSGLPPTYIDVGTLDIFLKEDLDYARRLLEVQIPVELHVYPGVPHAFEVMAPEGKTTLAATRNRIATIQSV